MRIKLQRQPERAGTTFGVISDNTGHPICVSCEKPWVQNEHNISCIPAGIYKLTRENNPKFGECFRLSNVPERDGILIHPANLQRQLRGCIAPGLDFGTIFLKDSPKEGEEGVTSSREAVALLLKLNPDEIEIIKAEEKA